jgi:hypothetical protein
VDGSFQDVPFHDSTRVPLLEPKMYMPAARARADAAEPEQYLHCGLDAPPLATTVSQE